MCGHVLCAFEWLSLPSVFSLGFEVKQLDSLSLAIDSSDCQGIGFILRSACSLFYAT